MKTSTKLLLLALVIIAGATLNQFIPNEFKYALGTVIGAYITLIWSL